MIHYYITKGDDGDLSKGSPQTPRVEDAKNRDSKETDKNTRRNITLEVCRTTDARATAGRVT